LSGKRTTIQSYAQNLNEVLDHVQASKAVIVAHSLGGLVATTFAAQHSCMVSKLVLLGPVKEFPEAGRKALTGRASAVRQGGMPAVADTVANAGTSTTTRDTLPLVKGYALTSLLSTPAEGYAQACEAAAAGKDPDYSAIKSPTLIIAGEEDKTSPKATIDFLNGKIKGSRVETIARIGHWIFIEAVENVGESLKSFTKEVNTNGVV